MPEIKQDFEIWAGEEVDLRLPSIQGANPLWVDDPESPVSELKIIEIYWKVTETADSTEPVNINLLKTNILDQAVSPMTWANDDYIIVDNDGVVTIELNRADTYQLGGNRYYHELILVDVNEGANVAMTGRMKINNSNFSDELVIGGS